MIDSDKSREQLIRELVGMRERVSVLETAARAVGNNTPGSGSLADATLKMAHELNNILTAIIGNIILLKMYLKPGTEVFDILAEAERASAMAEIVTRQLLALSAGSPVEVKVGADENVFSVTSGKRILVMDDEEIVRNVLDRMLVQCGFTASFAHDGAEMLKLYREALETGSRFDAVIVDLIIAEGMGGKEAIRRLLEIDGEARAIVSSGSLEDEVVTDFRKFGFSGVLSKPYQMAELKRILDNVLSGGRSNL